ncbi:2-hydroxychromene-2-carboxylate isomerase [Pseudoduganella namucuonensis]|uniref:2-hydroxychromene-2-carboxylate isomerase n=1 Tax=Pseudoduganella namucuonensis TaxID=1035707 RepID=A0A1I7HLC2_9BURK|nr:2-hydroxychromene-2-carboxylate isomerase [Pseudoduganella namucuonensis]SFU61462.1 2-hydroxychromene-2-carboxylate isomerase [Pseudoduganella namucuonensis]
MKLVRFYFDPVSPYSWLASKDIRCIEATNGVVECVPVLFAGLLKAHGQKGPVEVPVKRVNTFRDVMRLAAEMGLRFTGPPGHPFNPLMALRMSMAITDLAERRRFTVEMLAACWERGLDVSSSEVLIVLANECGLDGEALAQAAVTPEIKQALTATTAHAVEAGMFGVPTFEFEGDYFWGADRIDSLLWRMAGNRIDEAALREFLDRPALAQRRAEQLG